MTWLIDSRLAARVARLVARRHVRAQIRRELADTSDRALAEMRLARGDVEDVVSGLYRRAA